MSTDVVLVQADARLGEVVQRLAERDADAAVVSDAEFGDLEVRPARPVPCR